MTATEPRNLSKTSIFSMETLMTAPADLEVTSRSAKYRDLRKNLLTAFNNKAWGIRLDISAETEAELNRQINFLRNAGWKWAKAIQLEKLHGSTLSMHTEISEGKLSGILYMYFVKGE